MCDFNVDHFVLQPFSEPCYCLSKVPAGLEPGVHHGHDIDVGKSMADERFQVLWESCEGIIVALGRGAAVSD